METWRFLIDPPQSAAINMARDEAIAVAFSLREVPRTLRFYQWSRPAFSIGRFQKLEAVCAQQGEKAPEHSAVTLVRRMTGGRGLLHDREFTYSLVSDNKHPLFSSGIKGSYAAIAGALLLGLKRLGVKAERYRPQLEKQTAKRKVGPRHPLCFASTSWYEITTNGRKLIGSAQRRWPDHFLQHGSLILETSPIAGQQADLFGIPLLAEQPITLSDLLPALPSHETLIEAMKAGFESAFSIRLETGEMTSNEQSLVKKLVQEKYDNAAWNLRRERSGSSSG